SGMSGSTTAHSASVTSVSYRRPARLCCRRVVGVHMAFPGQASAPPWNHRYPGHSTLLGQALTLSNREANVLEIGQFVTLVHVAELGSLNKASARLHIVQPALSRQISLLEQELGGQLFER